MVSKEKAYKGFHTLQAAIIEKYRMNLKDFQPFLSYDIVLPGESKFTVLLLHKRLDNFV